MNTSYYEYYKQQASQQGAGTVFTGPMIQRGYGLGGIFRNIFSFIRPVLKPAAKFLGRTLFKSGANFVNDVSEGAPWKQAAKTRLAEAGNHVMKSAREKVLRVQDGEGGMQTTKRRRGPMGAQSKRSCLTGKVPGEDF